ncbi:helix-turn-helix domain-containing protein [Natrialba sp. INN-245]|uniref:winged helix-turn-helix domain-containing protein n=1 Tax=Natrialba sp. INN-245 TaxID=2690967 RepID=UPI00131201FB|nr:helix-turn-helix domain-containing protein [Natrialba sp. INN-245]MWV41379.1 helix-turn-helix domain-containing protein [Natrialba sp. INN-245]
MAIPTWLWPTNTELERGETSPPDASASAGSSLGSSRPTSRSPPASPRPPSRTTGPETTPVIEREPEPDHESEPGFWCATEDDLENGSEPDLERASEEFELLASPVRLEILTALADRDRPLRYSELRARLSIRDNGKLNYHLRTLEELVDGSDDGYALTERGRRLLEGVSIPDRS